MQLRVLGISNETWLSYQNAFIFFINKLKLRNLLYDRKVTISFRRLRKKHGYAVIPEHRNPDIKRLVKDFYIGICKTKTRKLKTLAIAHELVHVKQYLTGKLRYVGRHQHLVYWKESNLGRLSDIPYDDQPWEKEAYKKSDELLEEYERI